MCVRVCAHLLDKFFCVVVCVCVCVKFNKMRKLQLPKGNYNKKRTRKKKKSHTANTGAYKETPKAHTHIDIHMQMTGHTDTQTVEGSAFLVCA